MGILDTAGGLWTNYQNQQFAEEMASTQYQRATADMKAAGLNPMAVYGSGGGSPAAAPGGQATNPVGGGSSAMGALMFRKGLAEAKAAEAGAEVAESDAGVRKAENSAFATTLGSDLGKAAAAKKRYGDNSWLGAAGAVAGFGQGAGWGGAASAKAKEWWSDAKAAFGVYDKPESSAKGATT